ncbi:LuxR C-terminal-related transcriptional regulator [Pseudotamlana agarivorans]|uniref:LuxR C-terminal-related transcriptional regulator n=1 Tax=Pseudotamlana agarivorans TaxID=481183 RepID=UPI0008295AEE|nr:response regulator transcription factor [Tamlana agarivorans]
MDFLITDSYWASRNGLKILIEKNYGTVQITEFESLKDVFSSSNLVNHNSILLLDVDMNSEDFFNDFKRIKLKFPDMKIIVIISVINYFQFFKIKEFIHATLTKKDIDKKLHGAVQFVSSGYTDYFPDINQNSIMYLKKLTPRELEVAILISKGFSNKEIVWKLNLKKETISTYRKRVFIKLNVNNNIELTNYFAKSLV